MLPDDVLACIVEFAFAHDTEAAVALSRSHVNQCFRTTVLRISKLWTHFSWHRNLEKVMEYARRSRAVPLTVDLSCPNDLNLASRIALLDIARKDTFWVSQPAGKAYLSHPHKIYTSAELPLLESLSVKYKDLTAFYNLSDFKSEFVHFYPS